MAALRTDALRTQISLWGGRVTARDTGFSSGADIKFDLIFKVSLGWN